MRQYFFTCQFSCFVFRFAVFVFKTLDIEYRFDDKMPPQDAMHDKWRTMTFGKGGSTFRNGDRVKLPHMKPNVHGVIKFFRTEV